MDIFGRRKIYFDWILKPFLNEIKQIWVKRMDFDAIFWIFFDEWAGGIWIANVASKLVGFLSYNICSVADHVP